MLNALKQHCPILCSAEWWALPSTLTIKGELSYTALFEGLSSGVTFDNNSGI